jgi:hypothetical protein
MGSKVNPRQNPAQKDSVKNYMSDKIDGSLPSCMPIHVTEAKRNSQRHVQPKQDDFCLD